MIASLVAVLFVALPSHVWGHGAVSRPSGRVYPPNPNCPWCMGEMKHGSNPYGTVNRNERLSSPCMGTSRGDSTRSNWGPYANVAGEFERPTYTAGQTFTANVVLDADHGGDAQWQICPHSQAETEECFLQNRITDWKDVHCPFGRCDAGPHKFDRQSYTDTVPIPSNFPSGGATLRWYWVCKWTNEVFTSCIDANIVGGGPPTPAPAPGDAGCAADGDDCSSSSCCADQSKTCYVKDQHWASCRSECTPGIWTEDPPQYRTPWACDVRGLQGKPSPTPKPVPPPTPTLPEPSPSPSPNANDFNAKLAVLDRSQLAGVLKALLESGSIAASDVKAVLPGTDTSPTPMGTLVSSACTQETTFALAVVVAFLVLSLITGPELMVV